MPPERVARLYQKTLTGALSRVIIRAAELGLCRSQLTPYVEVTIYLCMPKKSTARKSATKKRWSAQVTATSDATHPPEGLFKKDAATIARTLASKKVSPKGVSSGMRMLSFYINRAGKNLPQSRVKVLNEAKELLHARVERERKKAA
jgi:hypothetical protein